MLERERDEFFECVKGILKSDKPRAKYVLLNFRACNSRLLCGLKYQYFEQLKKVLHFIEHKSFNPAILEISWLA